MKSTWEEKIKISEEHEKDRLRLKNEQLKVIHELELEKEKKWQMLNDRMDLDLTFASLRELFATLQNQKEYNHLNFDGHTEQIYNLSLHLKEINQFDKIFIEQDTIIDVYRASIEIEASNLFKKVMLL